MKTLGRAVAVGLVLAGVGTVGCGPGVTEDPLRDGIDALRRNRYRRAEQWLLQAVARDPGHATPLAHLAVAQWKNGLLPEAIRSMQRASELEPEDDRVREYLGLLLLEARRDAEALQVLRDALERRPEQARLATALAVAHWRLGDTLAAADRLQAVLDRHRDYAPALYNMAVFLRDQRQDIDAARTAFHRYLGLAPDGDRASLARRALTRLERDAARAASGAGTRDAGPLLPGGRPRSPYESSSPLLINQAVAAIQRGDFDEAYIHLRVAVNHDEHDAQALWALAEFTEKNLESPDRAMLLWQDFARRFPDDPRIGEVRQRLRRIAAADAAVDEPRGPAPQLVFNPQDRRDPDGARRSFQRGREFQAAGDWDRALFFFTHAIEQDDTLVNAYVELGRVYERQGALPLAIEALTHAVRLRPDHAEARVQQARLLIRTGDAARARNQLQTALRLRPDLADAHLLLGFLWRDDPATRPAARQHLQQYLVLAPDGEMAGRVRQWLDREHDRH